MNALDKVIGYFSPERAYRRARFRAATEMFAYDGAKSGRRTDGWMAAGGDANTEVGASLINLRNRSRDLLRNNPYASKAIAELVGNTVGNRDRSPGEDRDARRSTRSSTASGSTSRRTAIRAGSWTSTECRRSSCGRPPRAVTASSGSGRGCRRTISACRSSCRCWRGTSWTSPGRWASPRGTSSRACNSTSSDSASLTGFTTTTRAASTC